MDLPLYPIRSLRYAGAVIRARRSAHKLSQKEFGKTSDTAQSTVSDVKNGVVSVSLDVYLAPSCGSWRRAANKGQSG
ncbi:MAG: helix-turn-helix transcriptional regulator [Loktanella sp.]|nr:helix-turn-helix transcriptional regulator [Loktanella sp.]